MSKLTIDLSNLNPLALEITKTYLNNHEDMSPKMYTSIFISTYILICSEIENITNSPELLKKLIDSAFSVDFPKYDKVDN